MLFSSLHPLCSRQRCAFVILPRLHPALPPPPFSRGGLVGPWTALSPLMALCTDPLEEIRSRALRMLRHLCDKCGLGAGATPAPAMLALLGNGAGCWTSDPSVLDAQPPVSALGPARFSPLHVQPRLAGMRATWTLSGCAWEWTAPGPSAPSWPRCGAWLAAGACAACSGCSWQSDGVPHLTLGGLPHQRPTAGLPACPDPGTCQLHACLVNPHSRPLCNRSPARRGSAAGQRALRRRRWRGCRRRMPRWCSPTTR